MPDHSTLSRNRHGRFRESDLLRRVFETVLRRCIRESLVGGEGFAVDASLIKADANRQKGIEGDKDLPPDAGGRAVEEYLAVLDDATFGAATDDINETDAGALLPIPRSSHLRNPARLRRGERCWAARQLARGLTSDRN